MYSCTLNNSTAHKELNLSVQGYSISIFDKIELIKNEWNALVGANLFMHSSFLTALEQTPPSRTSYQYVLVKRDSKVVGLLYFQLKKIDLYRSLRLDAKSPDGFWKKVLHWVKSALAKPLKANLLVAGNMTLTGSNGFIFDAKIGDNDAFKLVKLATQEVITKLKKEGSRVAAILIKDFYEASKFEENDMGYTEFKVQPNMILDVDPQWESFDDYLSAMKSKYRVRVRRARKKANNLHKRVLSLEEIHAFSSEISELYKNVADQAGFNLFILPQNYFYSLQKHLKDKMELVGYFQGDKMVGFYTHIKSNGDLDAHFLGYESNCNRECQLYLNMLYDLVESAIRLDCKKLIMSRTALEIKSSVGAEAHPMVLYLKANNSILNLGAAKALSYFKPNEEWVPRTPFK